MISFVMFYKLFVKELSRGLISNVAFHNMKVTCSLLFKFRKIYTVHHNHNESS